MRNFSVTIQYRGKIPAFETSVQAVSRADAEHQALRLAGMNGWPQGHKKIMVREVE